VRSRLELTEVELPLRPGAEALDGLRLAFVSDVHAGSFCTADDLCALFARVMAANPDLVLLGGDLINTREREILLFDRALASLRPRLGVFAVPGNHDHFFGPDIGLWLPGTANTPSRRATACTCSRTAACASTTTAARCGCAASTT